MKEPDMSRTARGGGYAVQTAGLARRFDGRTAVDRVDLLVPAGTAFGYLGPGGAGKTTLIRMLPGLTAATSGSARVRGHPGPGRALGCAFAGGAMAGEPRFLMPTSRIQMQRLGRSSRPAAAGRVPVVSGAYVILCPPRLLLDFQGACPLRRPGSFRVFPARSRTRTRLMAFRPSAFSGVVNPE